METAVPLLPLLRSRLQGDLLALLFLHPTESYSLTEVARQTGATVRSVHSEANRLAGAGLIREERSGNMRRIQAATDNLLFKPLTDLLAVTYGPLPLLRDALAGVSGIDKAYIYGSWAARYSGESGPPPGDVDVLIIGHADEDDLADAVAGAARTLRREVNVRRIRRSRWAEPGDDPFLASVRSRPLVTLTDAGADALAPA